MPVETINLESRYQENSASKRKTSWDKRVLAVVVIPETSQPPRHRRKRNVITLTNTRTRKRKNYGVQDLFYEPEYLFCGVENWDCQDQDPQENFNPGNKSVNIYIIENG